MEAITRLLQQARDKNGSLVVFASDHLSGAAPGLSVDAARASGCLVAFASTSRITALVWFKPEAASTVTWGGDPR